jgi:hypothetical protein
LALNAHVLAMQNIDKRETGGGNIVATIGIGENVVFPVRVVKDQTDNSLLARRCEKSNKNVD